MARDVFNINVMLDVEGPQYDLNGREDWNEHYHGNKELKQDIVAAVKELLENTLTSVVVNGEEMDLSGLVVQFDGMDVEVNQNEQALMDQDDADEQAGWDAFQAELDRRGDEIKLGVYSMGDLSGPTNQLDEVAHKGMAMVVIRGGWGDKEPVFSDSAIMNPTNWDMFRMFDQALVKSQDHHHVFLEALHYTETDADGVAIYEAMLGS
jgi:hypothetical protein